MKQDTVFEANLRRARRKNDSSGQWVIEETSTGGWTLVWPTGYRSWTQYSSPEKALRAINALEAAAKIDPAFLTLGAGEFLGSVDRVYIERYQRAA